MDLTLEIYSPGSDGTAANDCLLYAEKQTGIDLSLTGGVFSVQVGSIPGAPKRAATGNDPGLTMAQIFSNKAVSLRAPLSANCVPGYTPASGDARMLRVTVTDGGVPTVLTPDQVINAVPQATNAETLQGVDLANIIQATGNVSQSTLATLVGTGDASTLHHHDSLYLKNASSSNQNLGSATTYTSGKLGVGTSAPSASLEVVGPTGAAFRLADGNQGVGKVLISDATGNATWQSVSSMAGATGASGADGASGATGASGVQGNSGATGASGVQGNSGATGASGNDGAVGSTGASGFTGATGANGAQGNSGATGATGADGAVGTTGASGGTGAQGAMGNSGATGASGAQGSSGATGASGTDGAQGNSGATGASGAQGNSGVTGASGAQGMSGATGASGNDGAVGNTGASGAQGMSGATGASGNDGAIGNTGASGFTGATGANGAQGNSGATGATGADGAVGNSGASGVTGANGAQGNSGASGATGANGAQGNSGASGATGANGAQGNSGATGATGADGSQGAVGMTGASGATGANGAQGNSGASGATGANGAQGNSGATGASGSDGAVGNTGASGATGAAGAQGNSGLTGATGADGANGFTGASGATGANGVQGNSGATGATGASPFSLSGSDAYYSAGNVGIGTASPSEKLHVNGGSLRVSGTLSGTIGQGAYIDTNTTSGGARLLSFGTGATVGEFKFYQADSSNSTNRVPLVIDTAGKVGVGTQSPAQQLEVSASGFTYAKVTSTGSTAAGVQLKSTLEDWMVQSDSGIGNHGLAFYDAGRTQYRMLIDASGNVGIGTVSPDTKLHVAGSLKIVDGTQGDGKILTSNASGVASWSTPSSFVGATGASGASGAVGASGATGATGASPWTLSGSDVQYTAGNVGIGAAASANRALTINRTTTSGSGQGSYIYHYANPSADSSSWYYGSYSNADVGGNVNYSGWFIGTAGEATNWGLSSPKTLNNMAGLYGYAINDGTANVSNLYGTWSQARNNRFTGTATNQYGVYGQAVNYGGAVSSAYGVAGNVTMEDAGVTMSNAYGLHTSVTRVSGNITNAYGLYVGGVVGTNKWSLYASDTAAPSYFGGNVGIGTSSPAAKLHVVGPTGTAFQLADGTQGAGKYLTSDANGNASWATLSGSAGATGASGITGVTGATGASGAIGNSGSTGASGAQGMTGATGASGADGATGNSGASGATGAQGGSGATGATGASPFTLNGSIAYYNSGNVGIGTSTPGSKFGVYGTGNDQTSGAIEIINTTNSASNAAGAQVSFTSGSSNGAVSVLNANYQYPNRADSLNIETGTMNNGVTLSGSTGLYGQFTRTGNTLYSGLTLSGGSSNLGVGGNAVVNGQLQILGGSPGVGKILVSDATGVASWSSAAAVAGATGATGASGAQGTSGATGATGASPFTLSGSDVYYAGGNVGIGTTGPTGALHVVGPTGAAFVLTDGTQGSGKVLTSDANGKASWQTPASGTWSLNGSSTYYSAGNVGIGTSSPQAALHVNGDAIYSNDTSDAQIRLNPIGGFTNRRSFYSWYDPTGTNGIAGIGQDTFSSPWSTNIFAIGYGGSTLPNIRFVTGTSASNAPRMTITNSGNVGIGTTSPSAPLQVAGDAYFSNSGTNDATIRVGGTAGYTRRNFYTWYDPAVNSGGYVGIGQDPYYANWSMNLFAIGDGTNTAPRIDFITGTTVSNSPKVSIVNDGKVGIGTTAPATTLHVVGATGAAFRLADGNQGAGKILTSDASGNGTWSSAAAVAGATGASGASGVTGATGASPFSLNGSSAYYVAGNVGIGTTGPAVPLEVVGASKFSGGDTQIQKITVSADSSFLTANGNLEIYTENNASEEISLGVFYQPDVYIRRNSLIVAAGTTQGANASISAWGPSSGWANYLGQNLLINGGPSTGNAAGGYVSFGTSPAGGSAGSTPNAAVERMRITPAGNVGIGTTAPATTLHVVGATGAAFRLADGNQGAGKVLTSDASGNATWSTSAAATPAGSNTHIQFNNSGALGANANFTWNNATERMGVGASSPGAKLHVLNADLSSTTLFVDDYLSPRTTGDVMWIDADTGDSTAYNLFRISNQNTASTKFTIKGDGTMNVVGMTSSMPASSGTVQTGQTARIENSGQNVVLDIGGNGGNGMWMQSANKLNLASSFPLMLNPNGGNVGIGTSAPAAKLEVAGGIKLANDTATCDASKVGTMRYSGGLLQYCYNSSWQSLLIDYHQTVANLNGFISGNASGAPYSASSASSTYPVNGNMGQFYNSNSADNSYAGFHLRTVNSNINSQRAYFGLSSTAGAGSYRPNIVIGQQTGSNNYSEVLRIDSSGNMGIGTTSPGYKLDVAGDVNVTGSFRVNGTPISGSGSWNASGSDVYYNSGASSDAHWGSVPLSLRLDGTDGSTTFTDSSSFARTMSTYAGSPSLTTSVVKYGTASLSLNGSSCVQEANPSLGPAMSDDDFTIEAWVYHNNLTGVQRYVSAGTTAGGAWGLWTFGYSPTGTSLNFAVYNGSGYNDYYSSSVATPLTTGAWHHVAVARTGSILTFYVDGTAYGTTPFALTLSNGGKGFIVGCRNSGASTIEYLNGYIDEVRVSKVPRYTANFTAPSGAFPTSVGGGNVGIGTSTPSALLHVNGTALAAAWNTTSDRRLKENVSRLEDSLEKVLSLEGVNYTWKDRSTDPDRQIGLIAQEVQAVFPEAVKKRDDGFLSVNYGSLVAPLIEALKSLHEKVVGHMDKTDERLEALQKENAELKQRLDRIERGLAQEKPAK